MSCCPLSFERNEHRALVVEEEQAAPARMLGTVYHGLYNNDNGASLASSGPLLRSSRRYAGGIIRCRVSLGYFRSM